MRTTAQEALWEVTLRSGRVLQGTEQELNAQFPDANWKRVARPVRAQATRQTLDDTDSEGMDFSDDPQPSRLPSSSRRYSMPDAPGRKTRIEDREYVVPDHTTIPPRRSAAQKRGNPNRATPPDTIYGQPYRPAKQRRGGLVGAFRAHPLLWLGIGMLLMCGLWVGFNWLSSWWQVTQDDWHFGRPRTAQYDVLVGHNDSAAHLTHIIAMNLHGRVLIIELPGGDYSKSRIYKGPTLFGPNSDLVPVTLTFADPGNTGHPEMLVHVQDATLIYQNQKVNGVWQFVSPQTQ
jgi:hypothetical protein